MYYRFLTLALLVAQVLLVPSPAFSDDPQGGERITISDDGATVEVTASAMAELERAVKNLAAVRVLTIKSEEGIRPDLAALRKMRRLKALNLAHVAIDDDDLEGIVALPELESLDLSVTPITDKGVADHLSRCVNLVSLTLKGSRLSNASLPFIGKLRRLRYLAVGGPTINTPPSGTTIIREWLDHLEHLDELEELDLRGLNIRDQDLRHFENLNSLRRLRLYPGSPSVSAEGLYDLKRRSPKIAIAAEVLPRLGVYRVVPNTDGGIVSIADAFVRDLERLGSVENMSSVESLELIQPPTDVLRARFPKVKRLVFESTTLDSVHASILCRWDSLEKVRLKSCTVKWNEADRDKLSRISIDEL